MSATRIYQIAFLVLILSVWPCSQALGQLPASYAVRSTVTDCLNVRPIPNTSVEPITCLLPGTPVTVLSAVPYWRQIAYDTNDTGWVAKKYIEPTTPPAISTATDIPSDAFLSVHFVDVGQGDAILIQTHDDGIDGNGRFEGYSVLIDGGPYSRNDNNPLRRYLEDPAHHDAEIEALIVTHPHVDHFRGAENASRHFDIKHYYDPGYPSSLVSYSKFKAALVGTLGVAPRADVLHFGPDFDPIDIGSEVSLEVLYTWPGDPAGLGSGSNRENNSSIVLRLEYGDHSFLFMGDAEGKERDDAPEVPQYVEAVLLGSSPDKLNVDVLKIAHHGSETSSTLPFIQAVDPEILVVQSGRRSFSGTYLPDASTLQRYIDHNPAVRIYRTDQNDEADGLTQGNEFDDDHIVIRTNGTGELVVEALEGGEPFP